MNISAFVKIDLDQIEPGLSYLFTYPSSTIEHDAIPALDGIGVTPAVIDPGRSIGQRASVSVKLRDFLHKFDTEDYNASTFWPKFRARYPDLQGLPLTVYRGEKGQELADMEARLYIVDAYQVAENGATVTAKDPFTLVQSSAAQAPSVNTGELLAGIDEDDTSFTLTPTGIGDLEYPASGTGVLGGVEVAGFTRSGDVVTLTSRGDNLGGVGKSHDEGTKFQTALVYEDETPSFIINDLLTNYTSVDASWITLADWEAQVDDYIARVYSAVIAEPISVVKLLDELCEQVGLCFYWDDLAQQLRLKPLAPSSSGYTASPDSIIKGSFNITEQPDKLITQAWTYYAQRDPTRPVDETSNYQRVAVTIADTDSDRTRRIRKVFARWIPLDARSTAERLNDLLIGRFKIAPRKFSLALYRNEDAVPQLGSALEVEHWRLVDGDGVELTINAQVLSVTETDDKFAYVTEEINFEAPPDDDERLIVIDGDRFNVNLRDVYDSIYSTVTATDVITFIVDPAARIGSAATAGDVVDAAVQAEMENPSLELGDTGWTWAGSGSGTIDEVGVALDGTWALRAGVSSNPNGLSLSATNDGRAPVSPGDPIAFKMRVYSPGGWGSPGDAPLAQLAIVWFNSSNVELSTTTGTLLYATSFFGSWGELRVNGEAPSGAAYATARISFAWGDGSIFADKLEAIGGIPVALDVGDWPESPTITLRNFGRIQGKGGAGAIEYNTWPNPASATAEGEDGGTAIFTRYAITVDNQGQIYGGGGGGGLARAIHIYSGGPGGSFTTVWKYYGGGGGAGFSEGEAVTDAPPSPWNQVTVGSPAGTTEAGGDPGAPAGAGGAPGTAGAAGSTVHPDYGAGTAGGAAGNAVDGESFITYANEGTIAGPRIN